MTNPIFSKVPQESENNAIFQERTRINEIKRWFFFLGIPLCAFAMLWGLRTIPSESIGPHADRQITQEKSEAPKTSDLSGVSNPATTLDK